MAYQHHDNAADALEKQLADLQVNTDFNSSARLRKVPPAVPPKKKAQPQVPHSAIVNNREPSYSTKISIASSNSPSYFNPAGKSRPIADYANVSHVPSCQIYKSNVRTPPKSYPENYEHIQYATDSETPPPLPPPPAVSLQQSFSRPYKHITEEYLPPPSPVSSNYSELARATTHFNYNHDRPTYAPIYQNEFNPYGTSQTSTYESIYEPINLRPQSNQSAQTNNSNQDYQSMTTSKSPLPKEQEVDALTNMLVQSISDSQDLDTFGVCIKCNGKVVGENSGCTAMGNIYHVKCFSCYQCGINLQGKPFYAVEGQPYCEADYYETLEKCCVCAQPILDRILRATGKPYHPRCFTCIVCGKSLDGIPFTVDAMNQIHCIEDFHRKFAPRCCVCELPIMPENGEEETVRVVALDRSFHVRCYRCEDCGLLLSSEAEGRGCYPLDDHILCKNCNANRIRQLTNVMTTDL